MRTLEKDARTKGANRLNNFDLIRLVAAVQVVFWHGIEHLNVDAPPAIVWLLGWIPGVPIFFVVSGYLVTASYRRSGGIGPYWRNRALRIFPGLWMCFVFCLVSIAWAYGLGGAGLIGLVKWIVPNLFGVSYTPAFLRDFGTGSVNGSLWTIPVELQFYLVLPLLVMFLGRSGPRWTLTFLTFLVISLAYIGLVRGGDSRLLANVMLRALPSWLYMFMLGMILELRKDWVQRFMADRFQRWLLAYGVWMLVIQTAGINTVGNTASPLVLIPLAGVVISAAYSQRDLASRLLRHNDVSYGVYLYHMPFINLLVVVTPELRNWKGLALCVVFTSLAAVLSWRWIESPALQLKRKSSPKPK